MLRIAYTRADGSVSVVVPAPADLQPGETEQQQAERLLATVVPQGSVGAEIMSHEELPPSRYFRDCWRMDNGVVKTDETLAKEQITEESRKTRDAALAASDALWIQAQDVGTPRQRTAVKRYRQRLRDLMAVVAREIAHLSVEELEHYRVKLPRRPF